MFGLSLTANPPNNLGVVDGKLAACPDSPNCVSTLTDQESKKMAPLPFEVDPSTMMEKIKQVVGEIPRTNLVTESENYLHFEFTSLIFRFVDDVEFYVDGDNALVHFRSASRVGHSDLGANRKRMQFIGEKLK